MTRILIVDDHEENYYLLKTILNNYEIETTWAKNGAEALETAYTSLPDLVISDILMPVLDGFGFCRSWKMNPKLNQIPFIFYSSTYTDEEDKRFAISLGADGYIEKGTEPNEFYQSLLKALGKHTSARPIETKFTSNGETAYYRMYNEVLIHKLETKLSEMENLNRALTLSEAGYRQLFDDNPQPMWIYDVQGLRFLTVNDAAIRSYGYSKEEFLSMTIKDIRPPEEVAALINYLAENQEDYRVTGPWRHRCKDGRIVYVEITSHDLIYQGVDSRFIMAQDITKRKLAEDALRLHSAALNSAVNAIVITDAKGMVEWANPAFSTLSGYSLEEVLGHNLGNLVKSGKQNADYYQRMWETISSGQIWRGEIINRRKDGSFYYEEESITPVCDMGNEISHFVAIKQDISERKQSERLLYENEERLRLALSASDQGLFDMNFQTGEIIVNPAYFSMLGYDPDTSKETIEWWKKRIHPEDYQRISESYFAILGGETADLHEEFRESAVNGEWKWILSVGKTVEFDSTGKPLRMVGTRTDITETKNSAIKMNHLLEESNLRLRRLAALREIDVAISSNFNFNATLEVIVNQVKSQLQVDGVILLLFDEPSQTFHLAAAEGIHRKTGEMSAVKLAESMAGKAALEGRIINVEMLDSIDIDQPLKTFLKQEGFVDYFGSPINAKGKLKGVLEVFHRAPVPVNDEWLSFFATLSGQAAVAIENAQLFDGVQTAAQNLLQAYDATIKGWSMAMDLRDHETEGHTERVTEMTIAIARRMNFAEEEIVHIRRGTLLHDIGKMGIPDSILLKPELLTPDERKIIEQHPSFAYEMLKSIDYLRPALTIPYLHHEKWDGTGYPNGLKGEEIPLEARLFAVVDVFDALTSDRPYRSCWSQEAALKHIQAEAGHHFDPEIVKIFTEYLASGGQFGC